MNRPDRPSTTTNPGPRIAREQRTIRAMIGLYCRGRHGARGQPGASSTLCDACRTLLDYAVSRLDRCPFGETKSTCVDCPVHCYKPAMRAQVREVMRYAGPRMLWRHPVLAVRHLLDGRRSSLRTEFAGSEPRSDG